MIDWFIRRRLAAFERRYGYDAGYARELLAFSRPAFMRYAEVSRMAAHRQDLPLQAWYAAKVTAARAEDCGPCTQLAVDMARDDGVPDALLRAVLRDDEPAMGEDAALGWRYARAAIARDAQVLDLREDVLRRWGPRALASLALVVTGTRMFPMLKYALGHGQACARVVVGGQPVQPPAWPAGAAALR